MEYFLIQQDKRYIHAPIILNLFNRIDRRHISKDSSTNIPRISVLYIKSNKNTQFIDLLDRQLFLLSDELKKLVEKYEPYLKFKIMQLIDAENSKTAQYHLPILDTIDCLSEKSELNRDKSIIKRAVLEEKKIEDKSIFKIGGVSSTYVAIRLDLAESILRRAFSGINLTRVEVE
ncbi:hypothetical protein SAMN05446037_100517 [Anaerovirgula multivorans]|uniref:Uncharacterized protein n=1 Tax=Anaerovirgula multivorans TaxID=312168 RepID=A0A239C5J2_9FIRM|nr:hypothetical protein [Anaerovirgula multivorans]SNS15380.1 hypothetical protein SAMN05446037_100517 [Anaerovirgula multivorans]